MRSTIIIRITKELQSYTHSSSFLYSPSVQRCRRMGTDLRVRPPHRNLPSVLIDEQFCAACPTIFTVWTRSLVMRGNGFTVFDSRGSLLFRVDNYSSNSLHEVVLMDRSGRSLLTMRRKRFSLYNRWEAFSGLDSRRPIFNVRKSSLLSAKVSAKVFLADSKAQRLPCDYLIERSASLPNPSFRICAASGTIVAEMKRKQASEKVMLGEDVLSLVVQPGIDQAFVMGLFIVFNQLRMGMV